MSDNSQSNPQRKSKRLRFSSASLISFAILLVGLFLRTLDPVPVEQLRMSVFDAYNRINPRDPLEESRVAIVDLDERSLAEIGQWPWPRSTVAKMLDRLKAEGVVAVGFDVVFAEPDRTSPAVIAAGLPDAQAELKEALMALPSNDDVLAQSMRNMAVILGQASTNTTDTTALHDTALFTSVGANLAVDGAISGDPRPHISTKPSLVPNIEVLEQAASGLGIFSVDEEVDGLVRRVPMVMEASDVVKPTLSLELLRVGMDASSIVTVVNSGGMSQIRLQTPQGNYPIPVDGKGRIWVNFAEPDVFNDPQNSGRYYVSASDVIMDRLPDGKLEGKLVLIGTSAAGLLDIRATPISPNLPGVEVHANVIDNILARDFVEYPLAMIFWEMVAAFAAGILMIVFLPRVGPTMTLVALVGAVAALSALSWSLYTQQQVLLDVTFPAILTFVIYAILAYANYIRDSREKEQVRGAFSQYLSPALVEQLADDPSQLKLGGETRKMTMLFCDVRGFTTISESFRDDPQGLTVLINRLLTPLTNEILNRNGTIDKYMGDCIMAFWNAPLEDPNQEYHAIDSAQAMFDSLEQLNAERKSEAEAAGEVFLPLNIGIGVNTGDVVVGNMGSDQRFDYSVLGDAVNLAARLEGQSKSYGVGIVIGPDTAVAVAPQAPVLELDRIKVKGKEEAVTIFTIAGRAGLQDQEAFKAFKTRHDAMLHNYRAQAWDDTLSALSALEGGLDGAMDGYYEIWKDRIADLRGQELPSDWDGVFVATTK